MQVSLGPLPGLWARLQCLAELRKPNDCYAHWGLARKHGAAAAQLALVAIHQKTFNDLLCAPYDVLVTDLQRWAEFNEVLTERQLKEISALDASLVPSNPEGTLPEHFTFVLHAVGDLLEASPRTLPQAA